MDESLSGRGGGGGGTDTLRVEGSGQTPSCAEGCAACSEDSMGITLGALSCAISAVSAGLGVDLLVIPGGEGRSWLSL